MVRFFYVEGILLVHGAFMLGHTLQGNYPSLYIKFVVIVDYIIYDVFYVYTVFDVFEEHIIYAVLVQVSCET